MKKKIRGGLALLSLVSLLLTGCTAPAGDQTAVVSPTPPVVEAPDISAQGALADAARKRMAPYQPILETIAAQAQGNLTYTIPGDMIAKMARDAQAQGVQAENGRYLFTVTQSSRNTYVATGLEVQQQRETEPTALPDEDSPMDDQKMGDFSAAGGGLYERTARYDVAADLSAGTAEITDSLNGEITGHEVFSFALREDALYFVDGALDLTANLDELESLGTYLVAAGRLEKEGAEIVEYQVSDGSRVLQAALVDWQALLSGVTPLSHVTAQGNQVTVR